MASTEIGVRGDAQALIEENYILKNQFKSLGLSSVFDVLQMSRTKFIEEYKEKLLDEAKAKKVYDWAIEAADQVAKRYHAGNHLARITQLIALNQSTPKVSVLDNRGLSVRQLDYYRREEKESTEVRIGLHRYDNRGQLIDSVDARLSNSYLKDPSTEIPNQQQKSSLLGGVLQSQNVDAGKRVVLSDCRGKTLWSIDGRGTERKFEYDELGRVKKVYEKEQGKERVCSERFLYGDISNTKRGPNAVGQLLAQYSSSGYRTTTDYSILGQLKKESQYFLKTDKEAHWTEDETENKKRLEEANYVTESQSNALGEMLSQIDAKGNERKTLYSVSGQIEALKLKLKTGTEKILSKERKYSASGQLEEESLGNGIRMYYRYEGATQRLSEKEAKRISDNQSLQYLHYSYDPVGNILSIADKAKAIEHFKNEKTESINHYVYDSFYQLIESQGLESSQAGKETAKLPQVIALGNSDASRLVNYKRMYQYDAGGNLFHIQHRGANSYIQKLEIDSHSNRGIEERETGPTLKEFFDGNGNLLYLNVGQPLSWNSRNQLQETIQIERKTNSDKETYVYDSQGNRVEKRRSYLAQTQIHSERVRYLAGIELRERWQTDSRGKNKKIKEELQVIQVQAGEPIRILQWETGRPNEIENDTIYYSLSDQIGSNQLELNQDGEVVSYESYYPYGGTAIWATKNQVEADYKYQRYSGKERDISGLYYYGYRYYIPWLGRWVNADPSGISEGLNLFQMVNNNPITFYDPDGLAPSEIGTSPLTVFYSKKRNFLTKLFRKKEKEIPFVESNYDRLLHLYATRPNSLGFISLITNSDKNNLISFQTFRVMAGQKLTRRDIATLRQYTRDSRPFEPYSRSSNDGDNRGNRLRAIEFLQESLEKIEPIDPVVFRGTVMRKGIYGGKITEGDVVTNERFLSTSAFSSIAVEFSSREINADEEERILFLIASKSGRFIGTEGAHELTRHQREILHFRNRNFLVDRILQVYENTKLVWLSEVEGPFIMGAANEVTGSYTTLSKEIYRGVPANIHKDVY